MRQDENKFMCRVWVVASDGRCTHRWIEAFWKPRMRKLRVRGGVGLCACAFLVLFGQSSCLSGVSWYYCWFLDFSVYLENVFFHVAVRRALQVALYGCTVMWRSVVLPSSIVGCCIFRFFPTCDFGSVYRGLMVKDPRVGYGRLNECATLWLECKTKSTISSKKTLRGKNTRDIFSKYMLFFCLVIGFTRFCANTVAQTTRCMASTM